MIKLYACTADTLASCEVSPGAIRAAAWIDLVQPTAEEAALVEAALALKVPTAEQMAEIEVSSRLYRVNDTLYMTATLLSAADTPNPVGAPVTFVLAPSRLITVRHVDPRPFQSFVSIAGRPGSGQTGAETAFTGLLDAIINRLADVLEIVGAELDTLSGSIFEHSHIRAQDRRDFEVILRQMGRKGDLTSKIRESLVSLGRLITFASAATGPEVTKTMRAQLKTMARDVASLADHAAFTSHKINFLLDATLGLLNIEQNATIKIFSVVAVIFLPPTLIASIYGMNFDYMPELHWLVGYPLAVVMMILSSVLPYWYFKRRGWL